MEAIGEFFMNLLILAESRAIKSLPVQGNRNFNTSFCSNTRALAANAGCCTALKIKVRMNVQMPNRKVRGG